MTSKGFASVVWIIQSVLYNTPSWFTVPADNKNKKPLDLNYSSVPSSQYPWLIPPLCPGVPSGQQCPVCIVYRMVARAEFPQARDVVPRPARQPPLSTLLALSALSVDFWHS